MVWGGRGERRGERGGRERRENKEKDSKERGRGMVLREGRGGGGGERERDSCVGRKERKKGRREGEVKDGSESEHNEGKRERGEWREK